MNSRHNPLYRKIIQSARWRHARKLAMESANGLCRFCADDGLVVPATSVHHITPVLKAPQKAFEQANLVALCDACHRDIEAATRAR